MLFTYAPSTTLTRGNTQTVDLGTTAANTGIEGVSYDPATGGFIAVKESQPQGIFQTGVDFTLSGATVSVSAAPGTTIDLTLQREGVAEPIRQTLTREKLPVVDGYVAGVWRTVDDAIEAIDGWNGDRALIAVDDLHALWGTEAEATEVVETPSAEVEDAPADFTDKLLGMIIGLEITPARVEARAHPRYP